MRDVWLLGLPPLYFIAGATLHTLLSGSAVSIPELDEPAFILNLSEMLKRKILFAFNLGATRGVAVWYGDTSAQIESSGQVRAGRWTENLGDVFAPGKTSNGL